MGQNRPTFRVLYAISIPAWKKNNSAGNITYDWVRQSLENGDSRHSSWELFQQNLWWMGRTGKTTTIVLKAICSKLFSVTSIPNPGDSCNIRDGKYHESVTANGLRVGQWTRQWSAFCDSRIWWRETNLRWSCVYKLGQLQQGHGDWNMLGQKSKTTSSLIFSTTSNWKLLDGQTEQLQVILTTFFF